MGNKSSHLILFEQIDKIQKEIESIKKTQNQLELIKFLTKDHISNILKSINALNDYKIIYDSFSKPLYMLAENGWYLNKFLNTSVFLFGGFIYNRDSHIIDKNLCNSIDLNLEVFLNFIKLNYSKRYEVINTAIKAHLEGNYILSVPIFYIQGDGIFREFSGKKHNAFSKKKIKSEINNKSINEYKLSVDIFITDLIANSTILEDNYTKILKMETNTNRNTKKLLDDVDYNRHEILHGDNLNYGNKIASYKALSYVMSMAITLNDLKIKLKLNS